MFKGEAGNSTVEFGLITPMLMFLLYVVVDISLYMVSYLEMSFLVEEGVRIASITPGLELYDGTGPIPANHLLVASRLTEVMKNAPPQNLTKDVGTGLPAVTISTRCDNNNVVSVTINGTYQPLLPGLTYVIPGLFSTMEASGRTSYLFLGCS